MSLRQFSVKKRGRQDKRGQKDGGGCIQGNMNENKREMHCTKAEKREKKRKKNPKQRPLHSSAVDMDCSQKGVKIRRPGLVVSIGPLRDAFSHM